MRSVMKHQFSQVPRANIPRSSFDRSHGVKTTFDAGQLIPFYVDEKLPGDTDSVKSYGVVRMATPLYPLMDNMFADVFYFSVPLRLVWDNFQKFMGEKENPTDSTEYQVPVRNSGTVPSGSVDPDSQRYLNGSLEDYLGIPTEVNNLEHSALFHRAYALIWNEWFRDQNLQNSITISKGDGPDAVVSGGKDTIALLRRGKRHDYFTSSLPWPQKGTAVDLPLGTSAPVTLTDSGDFKFKDNSGEDTAIIAKNDASKQLEANDNAIARDEYLHYASGLSGSVDLSSATASTINQLRQAMQIQSMYEVDARSGTRYTEIINAHFGVSSPDQRLQRPEYLGGGSIRINVNPTVNQSSLQASGAGFDNNALGQVGAFATAELNGTGFSKSFVEHSIVIGLVSVRADLTYQQGLNRMFSRKDKLDYYWPKLSQIGEQAVLNKEIYAQGSSVTSGGNIVDDQVFGYQERYAEYRYKPSTIHGVFRSNDSASLDAWHLSEDFSNLPELNSSFIEVNPPLDRVVRVTSEPKFIGDFYHQVHSARPMPLYGVPTDLSRF